MRNGFMMLAAAAALACVSTTSADAGIREYTICWTSLGGGSDCATLPRNYSLPGLSKPAPSAGATSFTLTRSLISCLSMYVDTSDMRPYQDATIYAPKR